MITLNFQLQRFHDLDLLQHFLIIHKESGGCLFYHSFQEIEIQSDLISGFISAMSSMYGELIGEIEQKTIESLKYQGMTLDAFNGEYTVGILISEGTISTNFKLDDFLNSFELRYDDYLINWMGRMDFWEPEWIVNALYESLTYIDNLPHKVTSKKPKKQYYKVIAFLQSRCDSNGMFLFRKVLLGLKKFLDITLANTLDILMTVKREGLISPISVQDILEPSIQAGALLTSMSSDGDVKDEMETSKVDIDEFIGKVETESTDGIRTEEDVLEQPVSEAEGVLLGSSGEEVKVIGDGTYSFEKDVALSDMIQQSGDAWLRDIASEAITLHIERKVVVSNPHYTPIGFDSDRGTLRIRITCCLENNQVG